MAEISFTPFGQRDDILLDPDLRHETGYGFFDDGVALVSMRAELPHVTKEMVAWWFWWHPQADGRYQAWYPGSHSSIGYPRRERAYFEASSFPPFEDNDPYPTETIGGSTIPLVISFTTPEEFGFSRKAMEKAHAATIVCGHVGIRHLFMHTEMAHIFVQSEHGLTLVSRFWLGQALSSRTLRRLAITDSLARGMAEHYCIEYRRLAQILPALYGEFREPGASSLR